MFLVAETFLSINGEGLHAGFLAHFIRLAGCPLRCNYCDTAWAQSETVGIRKSLEELVNEVKESPAKYITLTGGEPLAAPEINQLITALLKETDKHLEIETSGGVDLLPFLELFGHEERLSFTADYKLPSSGMTAYMQKAHYGALRKQDVVKYVIGNEMDLCAGVLHLKGIVQDGTQATPIFSPVYGSIDPAVIVERVKAEALSGVKVQLQLHKFIWDPQIQGV